MAWRATRRETMAMLAAGAALAPLSRIAARPAPPCPVTVPIDAITDRLLAHIPEIATYNGVAAAVGGGPLARRMDDYSPAGEAAWRAALRKAEADLSTMRCDSGHVGALRIAVARAVATNGTRSAAIPYGRPNPFWFSGHPPYLVTQIAGPHIDTPNVMQAQQPVSTPAEVDAWIEKLDGFGRGFDGVIEKLKADEAAGCRPPRVLLQNALPVLDSFLAGDAASHPLIVSLRQRMAAAALDANAREAAEKRAITALERSARPAYARLREHVAAMAPRGRTEDGLWAQPEGEALYAANVRSLGDTPKTPDEIHRIGLAEVARISAEMDRLLRLRGATRGSIADRMRAMAEQPGFQFPDTDAGRAAVLDYIRGIVRKIEARQPEFLPKALIPRQHLEVRRVPRATEAGAPGAYYDGPSLDGSRPGIYWINLRDMKAVNRFQLPTVTYHEGVPGHHTQGAIALTVPDAPLMSRIASFNAYQEGWALYAERLAAELGSYRKDAPGDLGRLQDELLRAVRLVVDTGLHYHRWSRDKAIAYARQATGTAMSEITAEIERYMAWPGQALGYKLGQLRLLEMRAAMRKRMGKRFDRRRFHAAVLKEGAMPLDLIAEEVRRASA
jgi:uncharacterized protein (DUF885 family)